MGFARPAANTAIYRMLETRRDCENYPKASLTTCIRKLLVILNAIVHNHTHRRGDALISAVS
jgi:hypothetical protein